MTYVPRKRTNKKSAPKRSRKGAKKGKRGSLVKIIKSVISRQAEDKSWFDYGANQSVLTASSSVPVYKNLLPTLSLGTANSNRIGNEVMVKSGFIRGYVNILPYNSVTNPLAIPLYVRMMILSCKSINTNNLTLTPIINTLFDVVNGSVGFQGTMLDASLTLNKDAWICHGQKIVKIGAGVNGLGAGISNGLAQPSMFGYYDNSPMSVPFYFNFSKYLKKLKYDDNITNVATNKNLFFVIQAVNADGSSGAGFTQCEYHYTTRINYEDM